jgi:23S rRNA (adenine2503-C2)-methyltransferase
VVLSDLKNGPLDLLGLTLDELSAALRDELGQPPYRGKQIYRWIQQQGVARFEGMTDVPKELRLALAQRASLEPLEIDLEQRSKDGTIKYRFRTRDRRFIEAVYMPSADRKTLCVSTQVGCAMGCTFCMTATLGLVRQLSASEIVAQVHAVNREIRREEQSTTPRPLTNLVFMGMGEPLHNFENLKKALSILQSEEGANFSHRHITVSTVGLVPMIERLGAETDVKLAISLNATSDEQREALMPVNKRWKIKDLLDACRRFPLRQGRRITFEYVLMREVNDTDADAQRLAGLLSGIPAKVNLIPYNENPGLGFQATGDLRAEQFREILARANIAAFIRQNRGRDIAAACGQLANRDLRPDVAAQAPELA